jgi:hypothetical protein
MYCANFPSNVMADTARNRQSGSVADSRRALTVLGDNPDGCTQAILLAHGFKSQLLAELVRTKLVTEHYERDARWPPDQCHPNADYRSGTAGPEAAALKQVTFQAGSLRFHLDACELCSQLLSTFAEVAMLARPTLRKPPDQDDLSKPKTQARPTEERFLLRVDETNQAFVQ